MEIKNRYGEIFELEEIEDGKLKFKLPPHTRVGFDNEKLAFIDPPGGPFIHVGGNLMGKKVVDIEDYSSWVTLKMEETT